MYEKEALKMKCKYSKLLLFHIGLHNTMRGKYFVLEMIHSKFCKWYDEEDVFFQEFFGSKSSLYVLVSTITVK